MSRRTDIVYPARRRVCADLECEHKGRPQPWSAFSPDCYEPDGVTVRGVQCYCRPCKARHNRRYRTAWSQERKARALENQRNYRRDRRNSDPEWAARIREYDRIWRDAKRAERGLKRGRIQSPSVVDAARRLDAAPFAEWLRKQRGKYESTLEMGQAIGYDASGIRKFLDGTYTRVTEDTVSSVAAYVDEPFLLAELYPELYEFEEAA